MDKEIIDIIEGKFIRTIYKSDNYMVSKFQTSEDTITVTSTSFEYDLDQIYQLNGVFVDHPKYGFQFKVYSMEKILPSNKNDVISFLSSKAFKGIGKKTAEKIYDYFKEDTLRILKENPQEIFNVDLSNKQLASLQEGFERLNDPENEIIFNLVSNGFSNLDAQKIFNKFKQATLEIGNSNPFKYYIEVYGIGFDKVKNYASKIDFEDKEIKYKEALLINIISNYTYNTGDSYIEYDELKNLIIKMGGMNDFDEILDISNNHNYTIIEDSRVYLFDSYNDECFISEYLNNMKYDMLLEHTFLLEGIENTENELSIKYDDNQLQAIHSFFKNNFSIVVGGPGTGKSTIVNAMSKIFNDYFPYNNLIVVAPTGRAAKRINEICHIESKTIHSLLRWNKETNTFIFNSDNPIMYDAIIIDEFSMVDTNLFACLLKACKNVKKICIIGDENQLPSIRPGYVLNDLIMTNKFVTTHLKSNYRQLKGNDIIKLADDIINDNVNLESYNNDIHFLNIKSEHFDLVNLIKKDIDDGYSLDDIQVLAPMYKGIWGIDNLNIQLQNSFNPKDINKQEKAVGNMVFRENDKILQLKNRPSDDVYNGDIGVLENVDLIEKNLLVKFLDTYVYYQYDELVDISLAYAMSVHKAQGSEYPIVYFIINSSNIYMLNRNLIYTAISRAKVKLVIIGEPSIFYKGIKSLMKKRNTTLSMRILNE